MDVRKILGENPEEISISLEGRVLSVEDLESVSVRDLVSARIRINKYPVGVRTRSIRGKEQIYFTYRRAMKLCNQTLEDPGFELLKFIYGFVQGYEWGNKYKFNK